MLTKEEIIFLVVCFANFLIALCYLLWGIFICVPAKGFYHRKEKEKNTDNRRTFLIRFVIMLLCPVVGICFFLMGWLTFHIFFHQKVDLADVIFSKDRRRQHLKDDEEKERNMASMEETLAVGDIKNQRSLIMSVIQRDLDTSLCSIILALNSKDSETSHYAASALQDVLNDFRLQTQKLSAKIEKEDDDETDYEEMLIDYMGKILTQKIFTGMEQNKYVKVLEATGEKLYEKNKERFTPERYENIVICLLDQNEFEKTEIWCLRMAQHYPDELSTYKCGLKNYYKTNNSEKFFELLEELKQHNVVLDHETIEIIRVFC